MKYVISIDLGATNVRVGIISSELDIIAVTRESTIKNDKYALASQIIRMIKSLPINDYKIEYIGVSACGLIKNNHVEILPNLYISDFQLNKILENEFNIPCNIVNDANATALSEATFGAGKGFDTSYFITISSGIGGCLVYNNKLIDLPFELGHHLISFEGNDYEIEEILSGNGICKFCAINSLNIGCAYDFFKLCKEDNKNALSILDKYTTLLANMFYNIQLDYNTDCIILSGGVMKSADLFFNELNEKANRLISKYPVNKIKFVFAKFDQDAGLMGGATVGLRNII